MDIIVTPRNNRDTVVFRQESTGALIDALVPELEIPQTVKLAKEKIVCGGKKTLSLYKYIPHMISAPIQQQSKLSISDYEILDMDCNDVYIVCPTVIQTVAVFSMVRNTIQFVKHISPFTDSAFVNPNQIVSARLSRKLETVSIILYKENNISHVLQANLKTNKQDILASINDGNCIDFAMDKDDALLTNFAVYSLSTVYFVDGKNVSVLYQPSPDISIINVIIKTYSKYTFCFCATTIGTVVMFVIDKKGTVNQHTIIVNENDPILGLDIVEMEPEKTFRLAASCSIASIYSVGIVHSPNTQLETFDKLLYKKDAAVSESGNSLYSPIVLTPTHLYGYQVVDAVFFKDRIDTPETLYAVSSADISSISTSAKSQNTRNPKNGSNTYNDSTTTIQKRRRHF